MSLIKKADVQKHFAARRAMKLAAARLGGKPDTAGLSEAASAATSPNAATFIEDFSLEHSSSGVSAPPKP